MARLNAGNSWLLEVAQASPFVSKFCDQFGCCCRRHHHPGHPTTLFHTTCQTSRTLSRKRHRRTHNGSLSRDSVDFDTMTLFILTETSAGYALLKAKDKKLLKRDDLATEAGKAEGISSMLKLKQFRKFDSASSALEEAAALTDGKVCGTAARKGDGIMC